MTHYIRQMKNGKWMEVVVEDGEIVDVLIHDQKPVYDQDMQLIYSKDMNTCPLNYDIDKCSSKEYNLTCETCIHRKERS